MENTEATLDVAVQYSRVKGASWFPLLYKKDVMILGQGGIGSWLSAMLSRVGCTLHLYDHDSYEEHNMTGQFTTNKFIGHNKAVSARDLIHEFSPDCHVDVYGEYCADSMVGNIMLCGFDSITARRTAFNNWREYVQSLPEEERKDCFFQDGRLLAELLQIISIPGDRPDLMERYEKEYLFGEGEAEEAACTFKQTTHAAAMIASHMTGFLINWASNAGSEKGARHVPFYYEYVIPLNLTRCLK